MWVLVCVAAVVLPYPSPCLWSGRALGDSPDPGASAFTWETWGKLGSWLQTGPALVITVIWGSELVHEGFLSLSFCNSDFPSKIGLFFKSYSEKSFKKHFLKDEQPFEDDSNSVLMPSQDSCDLTTPASWMFSLIKTILFRWLWRRNYLNSGRLTWTGLLSALKAFGVKRICKNNHHNMIMNQKHAYNLLNDHVGDWNEKVGTIQNQEPNRMDFLEKKVKQDNQRRLLGWSYETSETTLMKWFKSVVEKSLWLRC